MPLKPKTPVRESAKAGSTMSTADAHRLIARFHTLNKDLALAEASSSLASSDMAAKRREIEQQLEALGGIEAYQQASLLGEQHHAGFDASQWVTADLKRCRGPPSSGKIQLLDVGAIVNHYSKHRSWIDCQALDLNSMDPEVVKMDFFDFAPHCDAVFDVVVLSLVINFVGSPSKKGLMLVLCEKLVKLGGFLYVVLPVACIQNSRYLKHSLFIKIMRTVGFVLETHKVSRKLAMYVFRRSDAPTERLPPRSFSKCLCRNGTNRNNFCVVVEQRGDLVDDSNSEGEP